MDSTPVSLVNQRAPKPDPQFDWIIVGGGIHGVHLAVRLLAEAGVERGRLRIVDPAPRLLESWRRCTTNTGMRYLRSPAVHHLDVEPYSLFRFSGLDRVERELSELFTPPYSRPSLELFTDHTNDIVERYRLHELLVTDWVTHLSPGEDGVTVTLRDGGALRSARVLLAMGAAHQPRWPDDARAARDAGGMVHHLFDPGYCLDPAAWPARVAVLGGGITAAQAALRLADGARSVHLASRHGVREHQFDSDPGWIGPKYLRHYHQIEDPEHRREVIGRARHKGSMPPDVRAALSAGVSEGRIQRHVGPTSLRCAGSELVVGVGDTELPVDAVLLATGFSGRRPGGALVDRLVAEHGLRCAPCGYPLVDAHLRWHPRIFVTGPLAELEIGPVARNIVGARKAAERIVPAVRTA